MTKDAHDLGAPFFVMAFDPDFAGIRRESFSKQTKLVAIEVAVPLPMSEGTTHAFARAVLVRAIEMTEDLLRSQSLDWPT
jgi:hypothetical protein